MNKIILLSLTLENFMAYACETFQFGNRTTISGKNAAGKSSICNAYSWLLFNTDMDGNDNPDIRREVDGKYIEDADVSVTAVFDIDGRAVTVQKIQKRKYDKKDSTKYADTNSYLINDVPKTLKEFNAFFDAGISTTRMCSNINAFLTKKEKEIREFLFSTVENISDKDIASRCGLLKMAKLLENYSRDEIEAMNKKAKTDVEKILPIIKGQIAEKERDISIKAGFDTAELELAKKELTERLAENQKMQTGCDDVRKKHSDAMDAVMDLQFKMNSIQNNANAELEKHRIGLKAELAKAQEKCNDLFSEISRTQRAISECKDDISMLEKEREKLGADWQTVNALEMDEEFSVCPMCKRDLPEDEVEKHRAEFETNKKRRLEKIEQRGGEVKVEIVSKNDELKSAEDRLSSLQKEYKTALGSQNRAEMSLSAIPKYADVSTDPEYQNLKSEMENAKKEADSFSSFSASLQNLKSEENQIRTELQEVCDKIASADTTKDDERLEELQDLYRKKDQVKTDAQGILDMLKDLDKAKNEALSDAINAKFGLVKWKLWELNKSGAYKSTCIPMVDGKSILTIKSNKGNRFLGRLDICNSLQKITGFSCPIWIDDCESLDRKNREKAAEMVDGQLVMMVVSDDDALKVEKVGV